MNSFELTVSPAALRRSATMTIVLVGALALAACGSSRFGGNGGGFGSPSRPMASAQLPPSDPIAPVESPQVISSPLPPAAGGAPAGQVSIPGSVAPAEPVTGLGTTPSSGTNVASLGQPSGASTLGSSGPAVSAPVSRSSVTGTWKASEAAGGSCKVLLSSAPSLDLYKASTAGCSNGDLKSVNAWELRDGDVYLYARGGVVARLKGSGGSFSGALAKSGAPVTLTK